MAGSPESRLPRFIAKTILVAFFLLRSAAWAQESHAEKHDSVETEDRPLYFPEIEGVFSSQFRTAFIDVPVWKRLAIDGRYYGDDEANIGLLGANWGLKLWRQHIELFPGLSVTFGSALSADQGLRTAPAATLHWGVRKNWFHADGYSAISLIPSQRPRHAHEDEAYTKYAYLSDGNHISANWKRLEGGFGWEHIAVREDQEWKSGGRFSIALTKHLNFVAFILAPHPEFRCGLSFHPPIEKD